MNTQLQRVKDDDGDGNDDADDDNADDVDDIWGQSSR